MSEREEKENGRTRRKHRRVAAREVTAEIDGRGGKVTYVVQNISTGGILITGGRAPPRGPIQITLRQSGTKSIQLLGHVVHELAEGIGVAFDPMSTVVAESLEKLIAAVDARNNMPPPLPSGRPSSPDSLPPALPSKAVAPPPLPHGEDPFASGPDPRPPRLGSPDEKAEYLRLLVKKRDEAIQRGRSMYEALVLEVEQLKFSALKNKSKLEAALGQVALGEAALASSRRAAEAEAAAVKEEREKAAQSLRAERDAAAEMLEQEQRRTLEAIAAVAGQEAKLRRFETETNNARLEAENARREATDVQADGAALRRSREELVAANRKAMEAQSNYNKERTTRQAAQVAAQATLAEARAMLAEARNAQDASEAENKKLTAELARLKQKLIAAENALERSATRKPADAHRTAK